MLAGTHRTDASNVQNDRDPTGRQMQFGFGRGK